MGGMQGGTLSTCLQRATSNVGGQPTLQSEIFIPKERGKVEDKWRKNEKKPEGPMVRHTKHCLRNILGI